MDKIEIKVLNPEVIAEVRKMAGIGARLTQRGHKIQNMDDFMEIYEKDVSDDLIKSLVALPHPTLQKLAVINVVIVGASRRFLAQITRHQNEVKFVSASLQYSDYSDSNSFCVPYEIMKTGPASVEAYLQQCQESMRQYKYFAGFAGNDAAGYLAPQGLRNVLIISATPFQWKHMIGQRACRRNTSETEFVMLKIWNELYQLDPVFFAPKVTGSFCQQGPCKEGKMCCMRPFKKDATPLDILKEDYPLIMGGADNEQAGI